MRRNLMSHASFGESRRTGVTASEITSSRRDARPVKKVTLAVGSGPRSLWTRWTASQTNGARHTRNTTTFRAFNARGGMAFLCRRSRTQSLEVLLQVHAIVEAGHLVAIAIEHERRPALLEDRLTDAALAGLRPAGMVHRRVHIGVKAILVGGKVVPGRARGLVQKLHLHDGLGRLEAVLPGNDHPHRRTVLVRECFAIEAEGQQ